MILYEPSFIDNISVSSSKFTCFLSFIKDKIRTFAQNINYRIHGGDCKTTLFRPD